VTHLGLRGPGLSTATTAPGSHSGKRCRSRLGRNTHLRRNSGSADEAVKPVHLNTTDPLVSNLHKGLFFLIMHQPRPDLSGGASFEQAGRISVCIISKSPFMNQFPAAHD
jgi:hypothetical protein